MGLWEDLLKSLKKKATEAGKKALESGKGELTSLKEHPFKTVAKKTEPGKLTQAFSDMLSKDSLKSGKLAKGVGDLSNLSQPQTRRGAGDTQSAQYNPNDLGLDVASAFTFGIATGKEMGDRLSSKTPDRIPLERPSIVSDSQPFQRQPIPRLPQQYVPGPEGSVLGGQGEVAPGYGMQSPQSRIPSQYMDMARLAQGQQQPIVPPEYLQMAQAGQQPPQAPQQQLTPGAFAGIKEGILGMPSTAYGQDYQGQEGRQTAYYAGKLIPDIIRSKLGINTTGEEAYQQQRLETVGGKKPTPEYKADLEQSLSRLPQLDEQGKILLYQKLAIQYPDRSAELKRIFFPQTQDNNEALMAMIAAGGMR